MTEGCSSMGTVRQFLREWIRILSIVGGIGVVLLIATIGAAIGLAILAAPMLIGAYVEYGHHPWTTAAVTVEELPFLWSAATAVWWVVLGTGTVAFFRTIGEAKDAN